MKMNKFMYLVHLKFAEKISDKTYDYGFSDDTQEHLKNMLREAEVFSLRKMLDSPS